MVTAVKQRVTVQPGGLVEVRSDELAHRLGEQAEVIVLLESTGAQANRLEPPRRRLTSMLELIESLPPGPRSAGTWEEVERSFGEERDAWDRRP